MSGIMEDLNLAHDLRTMPIGLLLVVLAYLLGSVSTAILTCRLMGLPDPREQGSRNPGATNVLRTGGKAAAAITLLGDLLKGLIPVLIARLLGAVDVVLGAVALAAVLGHVFPVFFGFKGGKGVATAFGAYLGIHWILGVSWGVAWLLVAALFRFSSLSALVATALAPLFAHWLLGSLWLTLAIVAIAVVVIARHQSNIRNLLDGTEERIGQRT